MTVHWKCLGPRPLTDAETGRISGGTEIVVVGRRRSQDGTVFLGYAEYGSGLEPHPTLYPADEGGGGSETPPALDCRDPSLMTAEELRDYRVSQEAARVASEIMTKPDKDHYEYGSYIYRASDGSIRHTSITRGGPDYVQPVLDGAQNYGQVLALIHTHTSRQVSLNPSRV